MFVTLLLLCFSGIMAQCPSPQDLPRTDPTGNVFLCATMWEHSHWEPHLSCGGESFSAYNGETNMNVGDAWNDRISSVVVRPGCHLRLYEHHSLGGSMLALTEGTYRMMEHEMKTWNDQVTSYACSCDYTNVPLQCETTEEYHTLFSCTNTNPGTMICSYSVQQGLEIGQSVTEGKTITESAEFSLQLTFQEVFTSGLKFSTTTTYDWSTSDWTVYSHITTTKVACAVPEGKTVKIVEIVGRCGDTTAFTGYYFCE